MIKNLSFSLVVLSWVLCTTAQVKISEYGRYDSIEVNGIFDTLKNPWVGGLNNPSIQEIDLNRDFTKDIVLFDKDHDAVRVFITDSVEGGRRYHVPEYESRFPRSNAWMLMVDYNHDGLKDIFTAASNGDIALYKNTSTGPEPKDISFQRILFPDPYDSTKRVDYITCKFFVNPHYIYTNVFNLSSDIPGLYDIDRDGDLDIFAFGSSSNAVFWYKNLSKENGGFGDSLQLELVDFCWGSFAENPGYFFLDTSACKSSSIKPPNSSGGSSRHEGSTMLIEDFDCNGLPDILLGDISFPKMVMGYNQGTFNKARIANQDTLYPSFDVSVNVENFPAGYLLDANVDGKKDLIVTPNATAGFNNFDQIHVYENKGTNTCPQLELMEKDFLVGDMIDLGTNAFPLVIDVDGDSLNDLLVGNFGVFTQSKTHESRISYLKNVGSKTNPKFHYITRDYLPIPQSRDTGLFPTAGDLDGDGDLDLLVGTDRGLIYYYENKAASRSDSAVWVKTASEFDTVNFGKSIRPYLFDVDNDGKLDLLIGSQLSSIKLYKNIGSTSIPNYSNSQVISNWGGIFVSNALGFGNLSIAIADLDTAGNKISTPGNLSKDRHVFVGTSTGVLLHYTGMNSSGNGNLTLKDSVYLYSQNISPSMGDITGDNKPDILYGQISGGLSVLLKDGGNIIVPPPADTCVKDPQTGFCVGQNELLASDQAVHVFPNPASSVLYVKLELPTEEAVHIEIRDLGGREIYSTTSVSQSHEISISDLGAGVYWVITSYQDKRFYNKVVKVNR